MSTVSLRPNATHHLRGKYTHTHGTSWIGTTPITIIKTIINSIFMEFTCYDKLLMEELPTIPNNHINSTNIYIYNIVNNMQYIQICNCNRFNILYNQLLDIHKMLTITLISTFVFYSQLSHAILGPNGQECYITNSNLCPKYGATFSSLSDSEIECEDSYECCLCQSITCGTTTGERCEKFKAEGRNAAFNVFPITIIGDTGEGAEIECSGDNACDGAKIIGTFIKELKCSENRACANSEMDLTYINDEGKVECSGDFACYNSLLTVTNAETLCCDGHFSCANSVINIINPREEFEIQCKETASCQDTTIIIHFTSTSTVTELNGIKCDEEASCVNANIHIVNDSPFSVEFEDYKIFRMEMDLI